MNRIILIVIAIERRRPISMEAEQMYSIDAQRVSIDNELCIIKNNEFVSSIERTQLHTHTQTHTWALTRTRCEEGKYHSRRHPCEEGRAKKPFQSLCRSKI